MPISQIGSVIYANQNMQIAATKQLDFQARVDFQNLVAGALANDKEKAIEETRELEEDAAINPDREHNRQQGEETTGEKEQEEKAVINVAKKNRSSNDEDDGLPHILDIRV
jgi:hypothetical protein